jgi:membrane protease YdiL (CAAX protease family)
MKNRGRISRMDGQPTRGGLAARAPGAWQDFFTFLRRPTLSDRAAGVSAAGFGAIARLFPLDLLLMVVLIGGLGALTLFGFELPEHALEQLELGAPILLFILVGAPVGEEILFRGWLSGRPGHVLALVSLVAGGALAYSAVQALPEPTGGLAALGLIVLAAALATGLLWGLRRRGAWSGFQRHFGWFYFASALGFAAIHLVNFGQGASVATLPLVLPQFVLGLILGYVRVQHGMWASILFHALHNAVFIGIVLAASSAA